jgi:hypothetical protein
MENTAEDLIAHSLQRAGLLVVKPKFDQNGADLLALLDVYDGAKFCRIQCKGRSLVNSPTAHVEVPVEYVTDGLVVVLYIEAGAAIEPRLYCFLGSEVRDNWTRRDENFVLNITRSRLEADLAPYTFDESRVREIKKAIINVNVVGEFKTMGHGYADITTPMVTLVARGTTGAPPTEPTDNGGDQYDGKPS